jgi:CheY-like chemotaxis protein
MQERLATDGLRRVQVADDESDIRTVARLALEVVGGFEVCLCASGDEVLELFDEFRPDLVVIDVVMPGLSGPEVVAELRRRPHGREVPVVFLTATIDVDFDTVHVIDVIRKPFDPMRLAERLRDSWDRAHAS